MPRKQLQARFDADVVDAVEGYANDHDISRSEAMRRMLRSGLSQNGYQVAVADGVGTATEIDALRDDLSRIERQQTELAQQRNQRIRRTWGGMMVGALLYIAGSIGTTFPPSVVAAVGVIVLAGIALATHNLGMIEEEPADE